REAGVRKRSWVHDQRRPLVGGRLSKALGGGQDRAFDPRRELHWFLFLEDLCEGRYRCVGNAADGLSAYAAGPAKPRASRLPAGRQLFLVSVFRRATEIPAGAGPLAAALA